MSRLPLLDTAQLADAGHIREQLEGWEQTLGSPAFQARHLDRLPLAGAQMITNAYVSLRSQYPQVRPDYIDVAAHWDERLFDEECGASGWCWTYRALLPHLHALARKHPDLATSPARLSRLSSRAAREMVGNPAVSRARDLSATGVLMLSEHFWHPRCMSGGEALPGIFWAPEIDAGEEVFSLAHEFGHLAETALWDLDIAVGERVFRALTDCLLSPQATSLIHYPGRIPSAPLPPGRLGHERQLMFKRAVRETVSEAIGDFAITTRAELFAEAFAFAHCGRRPIRARLRPFARALQQVGASTRRTPVRQAA